MDIAGSYVRKILDESEIKLEGVVVHCYKKGRGNTNFIAKDKDDAIKRIRDYDLDLQAGDSFDIHAGSNTSEIDGLLAWGGTQGYWYNYMNDDKTKDSLKEKIRAKEVKSMSDLNEAEQPEVQVAIKQGACPYCGSEDVEYGAIEYVNDLASDQNAPFGGVYYPCSCNKCGKDFQEHYALSFAGMTTDQGESIGTVQEAESSWGFNPSDEGMSGSSTYTYKGKVTLSDIGDGVNLEPLDTVGLFDVMSPNLEEAYGQDGHFMILMTPEGQLGFEADFGEDLDTMIYGYASTKEELLTQLDVLGKYVSLPEDIPVDEFLAKIGEFGVSEVPEAVQEAESGLNQYTLTVRVPVTLTIDAVGAEEAENHLFGFKPELQVAPEDSSIADGIALREIDLSHIPSGIRKLFKETNFDGNV